MPSKILFLVGSMNQTTQMHKIAKELPDFECWFSPMFSDIGLAKALLKYTNLLDFTILGGQFKRNSEKYLLENNLRVDYGAKLYAYDLVFFCTDMINPSRFKKTKTIWIQEGMLDPSNYKTRLAKRLGLPGWFTGDTSLNGSSNFCDIYCTASEGYKNHIEKLGTEHSKILVTGIPNYDDVSQFLKNNFPYKDYVMVATSDIRETLRNEDRIKFIQECVKIASGRRLLFKLHPNEEFARATEEIRENTPEGTLIFTAGNTNEMIANSTELITQYSTVVYIGLILGKPIHSFFDINELKNLEPIQNSGTSAQNIAKICRDFIHFEGKKKDFTRQYHFEPIEVKPIAELV
jgi:hypothetical protein